MVTFFSNLAACYNLKATEVPKAAQKPLSQGHGGSTRPSSRALNVPLPKVAAKPLQYQGWISPHVKPRASKRPSAPHEHFRTSSNATLSLSRAAPVHHAQRQLMRPVVALHCYLRPSCTIARMEIVAAVVESFRGPRPAT